MLFAFIFAAMSILNSCYYDNEEELYQNIQTAQCDTTNVTYSGTIAPIIQQNCYTCHSTTAPSGGVVLDTYTGVAASAANGLSSRLWGSINHLSGYSAMPKGGNKLTECELKKIEIWLRAGSPNN
jgi:uncharacterized membrane protein